MLLRCTLAVLALALLLVGSRAPGEKAKVTAPIKPVSVRFHDGTVLRDVMLHGAIKLQTRYGTLILPIDDVRRIEFGMHIPEDLARKLEKALENRKSDVAPRREAAGKELLALGRYAYPALQRARENARAELASRLEGLTKDIRARVPEYQLRLKEDDVVFTADSMFAGRLVGQLTGTNRHFGELRFSLALLRDLQTPASAVQLSLDGTKNRMSDGWVETEFIAQAQQGLAITASGELDFGQFTCDADGNPEQNMTQPQYSHLPWGALLGKIGEDGEIFVIGKAYSGKAPRDGKLYLAVGAVMSMGTGTYDVNISMGEP